MDRHADEPLPLQATLILVCDKTAIEHGPDGTGDWGFVGELPWFEPGSC